MQYITIINVYNIYHFIFFAYRNFLVGLTPVALKLSAQ